MTSCPCCSHRLLRHIQANKVYWFCRNCWQEIPLLESAQQELNQYRHRRPVLQTHQKLGVF